jgi:hypothetical protein
MLTDKFDVFQNQQFGKPIFNAHLPNVVLFMYKHFLAEGTCFKNGTGCVREILLGNSGV